MAHPTTAIVAQSLSREELRASLDTINEQIISLVDLLQQAGQVRDAISKVLETLDPEPEPCQSAPK